jgi:hypothetical protein
MRVVVAFISAKLDDGSWVLILISELLVWHKKPHFIYFLSFRLIPPRVDIAMSALMPHGGSFDVDVESSYWRRAALLTRTAYSQGLIDLLPGLNFLMDDGLMIECLSKCLPKGWE